MVTPEEFDGIRQALWLDMLMSDKRATQEMKDIFQATPETVESKTNPLTLAELKRAAREVKKYILVVPTQERADRISESVGIKVIVNPLCPPDSSYLIEDPSLLED